MRIDNTTCIIGVDTGYGNIKTANTVFQTGLKASENEPLFDGNILKYQSKWYKIGECHKDYLPDKTEDEDFYLLTLAAIASEMETRSVTKADVLLAAGLTVAPEAGGQMSTKVITVRLNLDSKSDSIIWEKLQRIHKQNNLSYGKAVVYVLKSYEPDDIQNDSQRIMTHKFANDVLAELKTVLPSFISGYIAGNMSALPVNAPVMTKEETHTVMRSQSNNTACDIQANPDFKNSHIDFGFAGS